MPIVRIHLFDRPEGVKQDMLDLEVEVSTEVHQRILDKTLRKLNVGPFEEGGSVFLCRVRSIDLSGEYPIIVMIPSPN